MLDLALKASEDHPLEKLVQRAEESDRPVALGFLDLFLASTVRLLLLSAIRLESAVV